MFRDYSLLFRMNAAFSLHEIICDNQGIPFDYRFLAVNPAFEKLTGLKWANIKNKTVKEVLPDIEPFWIETYGKVALKRKPVNFENYSKALKRSYEVFAYSPELNQFATIFLDITEHKAKEQQLKRMNRTLNALHHSSEALKRAKSEKEFLDETCKIIIEDCGHAMVWIGYKENDEYKSVRPVAYSGFEEGYLEKLNITWADVPLGRGPTGTAVRSGKPSYCKNILSDNKFKPWRQEALKRGYASSFVLPLYDEENIFGALSMYFREPDPLSEDEESLLSQLAKDLSYGIKSIRLYEANKQAQEKIERAARLWQITFDSIPDMVSIQNKDFELVNVNKAYERTFNMSLAELKGKKCYAIVHHSNCPVENCPQRKTLEIQQVVREEIYEPLLGVYFEITTSPLFDENGELLGSVHYSKDITHKKQIQEALSKSEAQFRILTEAMPQIVWSADQTGKMDFFNQQAYDLAGLNKNDVKNMNWMHFIHPEDYPESVTKWRESISTGRIFRVEQRLYTADGQYRWHLTRGVPVLSSDGKITRWIGTSTDIHEQKSLEGTLEKRVDEQTKQVRKLNEELEKRVQQRTAELQYANQELESFSYSVSHDLRTPLSAIDGFAKILYQDLYNNLDDEYRNYLKRIIDASGKMSGLITGFLKLSRISEAVLHPKDIRLDLIAVEILNTLVKSDPGRKVNIKIQPDVIVHADLELFTIVMENLINNAWKFTRYTNETIIQIGAENKDGNVIYYVKDNGTGFDMKDANKLFNPFQRLHDHKKFDGNGVGLATVKRIISKHGGKIWAESSIDNGTTFYFVIPM